MDNQYGFLDELKLTVLIEDYAGYDSDLLSQHGVSFLLEASHKHGSETILFDSGQSASPILHNMKILGKDPEKIGLVCLSHCHYDHTGGLVAMLKAIGSSRIPIVAHPLIHRPNYSIKPSFRSIGMGPENSPDAILKAGGEMILHEEPLPLFPGAVTTGEILERVDFEENTTLSLVTVEEGKTNPDKMVDDISMVFILTRGLVIVTGCSHAGVISIIQTAISLTGIEHIAAVIGGFHLIDADEIRINRTVEKLAELNIDKIYTGHCTGFKAEAKIYQKLEKKFIKLRTGLKINF